MHCRIAEIGAIISGCGRIFQDEKGKVSIKIHTENIAVARKYFTLVKKTYNIDSVICIKSHIHAGRNRIYILEIQNDRDARKILQSVKFMNGSNEIAQDYALVHPLIFQKTCCKRAFLRGMFLCNGSISEPEKTYHFEIV